MGFHENLDEAFKLAGKETVDFMVEKFKVTPYEAYSLTSILVDCRVTQVVDIRKGVHCMVPKKNFATKM
jgi:acetamidase/formamidase